MSNWANRCKMTRKNGTPWMFPDESDAKQPPVRAGLAPKEKVQATRKQRIFSEYQDRISATSLNDIQALTGEVIRSAQTGDISVSQAEELLRDLDVQFKGLSWSPEFKDFSS